MKKNLTNLHHLEWKGEKLIETKEIQRNIQSKAVNFCIYRVVLALYIFVYTISTRWVDQVYPLQL